MYIKEKEATVNAVDGIQVSDKGDVLIFEGEAKSGLNKAGHTAVQSRTVGQEQ